MQTSGHGPSEPLQRPPRRCAWGGVGGTGKAGRERVPAYPAMTTPSWECTSHSTASGMCSSSLTAPLRFWEGEKGRRSDAPRGGRTVASTETAQLTRNRTKGTVEVSGPPGDCAALKPEEGAA